MQFSNRYTVKTSIRIKKCTGKFLHEILTKKDTPNFLKLQESAVYKLKFLAKCLFSVFSNIFLCSFQATIF